MKGREVFELIPEEACRELEAIVGHDNITTDPVLTMSNFGFGFGAEMYWFQGILQPPAAIVMPKNTEEVARIVRLCNRFNIPFQSKSSGTISPSDPAFLQNAITIDLKRMDHWEIDGRNMWAIVEPGVISAAISAEANKRDMYYIVSGGGGLTGVLSNHFSFGWGHFCYRATPHAQRRVGGVEWVSPEGNIYRMGALSTGEDSWFWGDASGADPVGFLHGISCWFGGMGIVTRVSVKLYPFQTEPLEPENMGGDSGVKLPPRVRYYNITFPSKEALDNAVKEIGEADIGAVVNIVPAFWRTMSKAMGIYDFRNEFFAGWTPVSADEISGINILRILLVGRASIKQLEYEERVLMEIVEENGGTPRRTKQIDEGTFRYANTADMWMMTGVFGATDAGMESNRCTKAEIEMFRDRLFALPDKLDWLDQKGELPWYLMWNRGRTRYSELHVQPDGRNIDPEDPEYNHELTSRFLPWAISEGPTVNRNTGCMGLFEGTIHPCSVESPALHHYNDWMVRFKGEFDSNGLSGTAWPWAIDKVVAASPGIISEEFQHKIDTCEKGPWMGNPE